MSNDYTTDCSMDVDELINRIGNATRLDSQEALCFWPSLLPALVDVLHILQRMRDEHSTEEKADYWCPIKERRVPRIP